MFWGHFSRITVAQVITNILFHTKISSEHNSWTPKKIPFSQYKTANPDA
jgi:hypothetical protein